MKAKVEAHAVLRHDHFVEDVAVAVTVVAVVPTEAEARTEVERLSRVNADKDCTYFSCATRWYPEGRDARP